MCITDSLFNNYFEDIEDVLYNTERYPRSDYDKPYVDYFTDLVQRTDQYSDIATNDGSIQTEYVQMDYNGNRIFFFAT